MAYIYYLSLALFDKLGNKDWIWFKFQALLNLNSIVNVYSNAVFKYFSNYVKTCFTLLEMYLYRVSVYFTALNQCKNNREICS